MRWTHRCHPLMRRWVGWLSNIGMFFVGVCEDSYIKNITLFTAVPCPSCSTLTSPISRVTGAIIVAVTGLIAARAIGASYACYSKTDIINETMFCFLKQQKVLQYILKYNASRIPHRRHIRTRPCWRVKCADPLTHSNLKQLFYCSTCLSPYTKERGNALNMLLVNIHCHGMFALQ